MKYFLRIIAALLVCCSFMAANLTHVFSQDSSMEGIEIIVGKSQVMTVDFSIEEIATGNPEICAALKTGDKELLINAKKEGRTNVIVWGSGNNRVERAVTVLSGNATAYELQQMLKDIEGVQVRTAGQRIFVEGEVLTHAGMEKINKIVAGMPGVVNLVSISPLMKNIVKSEIEGALKKQGLGGVTVTPGKDKFVLTGKVYKPEDAQRAEKIALAFNQDVTNAIDIDQRVAGPATAKTGIIEMTLTVMEVEKNALKDIGIAWNPGGDLASGGTYGGSKGSSPSLSGSLAGTISNLFPKMRKIQEDGKGRTLMQQSLITTNGGNANFFAGSELPITTAQEGGTMSTEYKKVGVTLNFSPVININTISSPVKIESSTVTGEGPNGAPIIGSTQLETMLTVESGSSIVLGGLMGQKEASLLSKSPPNKGWSLFQSNKGTRQESETKEVLIFVTPRILASSSEAGKGIGDKVNDSFKKQEQENIKQK